MTETGWIVAGIIALAAIVLVLVLLRRKPAAPVAVAREAVAAPTPPQTLAAEGTSPAPPESDRVAATPIIEMAPQPSVSPAPAPLTATPVSGEDDNLLKLKGVGPKIAALLKAEGVTRYAQIAAWTDTDIAAIDARLGSFAGRPRRDDWVDQARLLAAGDTAGYEAKYGKL